MSDRFTKSVLASFAPDLNPALAQAAVTAVPAVEPPKHLVAGFILIAAATTMDSIVRSTIARRWATREADGQKSSTSATCKELNAIEWSWPSFDIMVERLKLDDLWPMPWHRYKGKIQNGDDLRDVKSKILVTSARTAAVSAKRSLDNQFMTMLRLEGWHIYTDSEVGAHYAHLHLDAVDPSDWVTWPPLYPGDLSRIDRGEPGVYSRFGRFLGLGLERPAWADPFK